jgi:hypothetical protein
VLQKSNIETRNQPSVESKANPVLQYPLWIGEPWFSVHSAWLLKVVAQGKSIHGLVWRLVRGKKAVPSTTAKTVSCMVQQNPQRVRLDRTMVPVLEDRATREPATPAQLRVLERHALPRAGLRQQMNCL